MPLREAWTGKPAKPTGQIIEQLVRCVCGNGNYLLSLGCKPDGSICFWGTTQGCFARCAGKREFLRLLYDRKCGVLHP